MKQILFALLLCSVSAIAIAEESPVNAPVDKDGIQRVEVVAGDYFFRPRHIVVRVNVPVELSVRRETLIVPHDIVIDAPEAGITINQSLSRDPKTFFFVPARTGKFPMYCGKKAPFMASHRDKGMEGILEVVE